MPHKIIFMGTPEFALPSLEILIKYPGFEVIAVVTKEDKKIGRDQVLTPTPVKKMAQAHGIPVLQPEKIRENNDFFRLLQSLEPDFIVVVNFGHILPKEILDLPKYGCINVHPSLLPKYRGTSPYVEALLQGDLETGVSIIQMVEKFDSGNIYLVKKLTIEENDNAQTLGAKLFLMGAQMLPEVMEDIVETGLEGIPQDESKATYCGKIKKEDGLIDLKTMSADQIVQRIKAYTPWPSTSIMLGEKRLKILEAKADNTSTTAPGKTMELGKNMIGLKTAKGILIPLIVQLEGKSAMPIGTFLAGNREIFDQIS